MASTDGSGAAPSPSPAPAKRLDFGADVAGELLARPFSLSPPISPPIDPSSMTSTAHPHTRPQDSMAVDDGHRRGEGGTEGVQSQLPAQFYTQSSAHPQSQSHSQSQDEGYQLWLAHQSKLDEEQRKQQQQQQQQSPGGESGASPDAGMAWRASPGLNDDEMRDGFLQAENVSAPVLEHQSCLGLGRDMLGENVMLILHFDRRVTTQQTKRIGTPN